MRSLIFSTLEENFAEDTAGKFFVLCRPAMESVGNTSKKLFAAYRKKGFDIETAAVSFMDGSVTAFKDLALSGDLDSEQMKELTEVIENLEVVIDAHAPKKFIAVRNGKYGQWIDEHMSEYLSK